MSQSETLRVCPACGGEATMAFAMSCAGPNVARVNCNTPGCGVGGPVRDSRAAAADVWNALPRWEWRPASQPPEVPEGEDMAYVATCYGGIVCAEHYNPALGWLNGAGGRANVEYWTPMPLPPGPGEGGR